MGRGGLCCLAIVLCLTGVTPSAASLRNTESMHPIHPLLPWHPAVRDRKGKLLAWYRPNAGLGYDRVLRLGWDFIERRVPRDSTRSKVYLKYAVFDRQTLRGLYWQHNPAFLNASFVDSLVGWYPYSGDRGAIDAVREMLDYQLANGTTPAGWNWPRVPFATSCAGARRYGGCLAGLPNSFQGGIETDKVGLLGGEGYLLFYKLTGERRYLQAAVQAGTALARHVSPGDAAHTPWAFRVNARTGAVLDGAHFGGMVVGPVRLLDQLIQIGAGNTASYIRARNLAWSWVLKHQLNRSSPAWNRWSGFYEDVPYDLAIRNQATATMTARYLLTQDSPETVDPLWAEHAQGLLRWVRTSFGKGPFLGAWAIDEQRKPGTTGCCSPVGLGSTTSRWAAVNALLYTRTGNERARELAVRSLNYATYFAGDDGRIACCGNRSSNSYWFSDGYGDYLRSFNWAMAAMPELAPNKQDHLLGSSTVVQAVTYGRRRLAYRTFDAKGIETLRLSYLPSSVVAGDRALPVRTDLSAEGYVVHPLGGGDFVVRIRHDRARRIRIA